MRCAIISFDLRLFFQQIKKVHAHERVDNGTIVVIYCPTKEMVSDYLSKPLQGSLFRTHSNSLMGILSVEEI